MKKESFEEMIKYSPENLNILWNERRCMLLALIATDFDLSKSWLINAPEMPLVSYKTKFYRHNLTLKYLIKEYSLTIKNIKQNGIYSKNCSKKS